MTLLLLACAPVDQAYVVGIADLQVEPRTLDFGALRWGETAELSLSLQNADSRTADIGLELKGRGFTVERRSLELASGEEAEVAVWFTPYAEADATGEILVTVDELLVRVELQAATVVD